MISCVYRSNYYFQFFQTLTYQCYPITGPQALSQSHWTWSRRNRLLRLVCIQFLLFSNSKILDETPRELIDTETFDGLGELLYVQLHCCLPLWWKPLSYSYCFLFLHLGLNRKTWLQLLKTDMKKSYDSSFQLWNRAIVTRTGTVISSPTNYFFSWNLLLDQ